MKVLITGSNGFIAKKIAEHYHCNDITLINRNILDLRDRRLVDEFLYEQKYDVLFHTAMVGGRRDEVTDSNTLSDNITMFYNIMRHRDKFIKIFNFGSGAELDRYTPTEDDEQFPIDPYGLSKNIMYRIGSQFENVCNLRIYNVFGENEPINRMIFKNIQNYINKQSIDIQQDKLMDFFYIKDLLKVIDHCISTGDTDIDCVYPQKFLLSEVAEIINNCNTYKVPINISTESIGMPYIGKSTALNNLNIDLLGLKTGVEEIYTKLVVNY